MTLDDDTLVHQHHCCKLHGCKYGEEDCPVARGEVPQIRGRAHCQEPGLSADPLECREMGIEPTAETAEMGDPDLPGFLTHGAAWLYVLGVVYADAAGTDVMSDAIVERLGGWIPPETAVCEACPACAGVSALIVSDVSTRDRAMELAQSGARAVDGLCDRAAAAFLAVRAFAALPDGLAPACEPPPYPEIDAQRFAHRERLLTLPTHELVRYFRENYGEHILDGLEVLFDEEAARVAAGRCKHCGEQHELPVPHVGMAFDVVLLLLTRLYVGEPDRNLRRLLAKELSNIRAFKTGRPRVH